MASMILDAHVHVWQANTVLYRPGPPAGSVDEEIDAPAGLLLHEMRASGVDGAILVQPSNYGFDNRYLADCLGRYPGRFAGVARIDPVDASAASRLGMWVQRHGIRGLRIAPLRILDGEWVNDPRISPLWDKAVELAIPVCFQGKRGQMGALVALVDRLSASFPTLRIALDHMGHPDVRAGTGHPHFTRLLALARREHIYVKVSGHYGLSREPYPYRDTWPIMQALFEHFGPQRLMWGTDFPYILFHCGYARALALVREELPFLTAEDKEWILGKTAATLWALEA